MKLRPATKSRRSPRLPVHPTDGLTNRRGRESTPPKRPAASAGELAKDGPALLEGTPMRPTGPPQHATVVR